MALRNTQPIALVIFDAFDTLITPRIAPYLQYAEEARKLGLDVDEVHLKPAFKASFKRLVKAHPTYGRHTGLPTSDEWWLMLIEDSLLNSGVPSARLAPVLSSLGTALLRRFGTAEAYQLAEGVPSVLQQLSELHSRQARLHSTISTAQQSSHPPAQFAMSLATNSDARILDACKDLDLDLYLDLSIDYDSSRPATELESLHQASSTDSARRAVSGPTLSYDVGYEKPDARFFHAAVQRAFPRDALDASALTLQQMCRRTLYVGDSYEEDYLGAKQAGLQAVWLRRAQPLPDAAHPANGKNTQDVKAVTSMLDIIHIVQASWR